MRPTQIVFALLIMTAIGCSDGRPARLKASGQVLLNGEPLTFNGNGFVQIVPENSRPATGKINPNDGTFTLTTFENQDGVTAGTHRVTVTAMAFTSSGSTINLLPEKYSSTSTSGLTVTIEKPTDSLRINLEGKLKEAPDASRQPSFAGDDPGH